ncbi:hypothetical protein FHW03_005143 [Ochrobactrum sp. RH2CCR150]|nr:hypothetical protein [Ochrobactrum sp. RH2CCR150]
MTEPAPTENDQMASIQPLLPVFRSSTQANAMMADRLTATIESRPDCMADLWRSVRFFLIQYVLFDGLVS